MTRRRSQGSVLLETVLYLPILIGLLIGILQLARISYTYYTLQKILYTVARYVGTQQGINFCDGTDATVTAAKNLALTGTTDGSGPPILPNLTADQIDVRIERFISETADLSECGCDATSCDTANGGQAPDWVVVSVNGGYPIQLNFQGFVTDPIPLRPQVRIPYTGT